MRSGRRNNLIQIQSVTTGQDDNGEETRSYATVWSPWANIVTASGGETLDGKRMAVVGECTHVLTIPYRDGVTRDHRVLWGTRTLEILSAFDPDNNFVDLVLQCREVL